MVNRMSLDHTPERRAMSDEEALRFIVEHAEKDRFALIIPEEWEPYVHCHIPGLMQIYPCTGVLVKQSVGGTAYHVVRSDRFDDVCKHGLKPAVGEFNTFGDGVIYAYPTPMQAAECHYAYGVVRIEYGPGAMRSTYTADKEDFMQGEIIIPPECVISIAPYMRRVPNDTKVFYTSE